MIDWKQQPKGSDLRPRITLRDDDGEVIQLTNGAEARYFMSVDAILSVEPGAKVYAGDVLARIPRETSKTRDITGGLPRVAGAPLSSIAPCAKPLHRPRLPWRT